MQSQIKTVVSAVNAGAAIPLPIAVICAAPSYVCQRQLPIVLLHRNKISFCEEVIVSASVFSSSYIPRKSSWTHKLVVDIQRKTHVVAGVSRLACNKAK